jgi:hypothetical protein
MKMLMRAAFVAALMLYAVPAAHAQCTGGLLANCPAASGLSGSADGVWVDQPSLAPNTSRRASPNQIVGAAVTAFPALSGTTMPIVTVANLPGVTSANVGFIGYATNCRNSGEGSGAGTGCLVAVNKNGSWVAVWSGLSPAA